MPVPEAQPTASAWTPAGASQIHVPASDVPHTRSSCSSQSDVLEQFSLKAIRGIQLYIN